MHEVTVTKTRFEGGLWEGVVDHLPQGAEARITVTCEAAPVPDVSLSPVAGTGQHLLRVPVPPEAIGDGIRTILIRDDRTGEALAQIAILAGEALADTLQAEVDLLREELDMLKRAFRRHCVETAGT